MKRQDPFHSEVSRFIVSNERAGENFVTGIVFFDSLLAVYEYNFKRSKFSFPYSESSSERFTGNRWYTRFENWDVSYYSTTSKRIQSNKIIDDLYDIAPNSEKYAGLKYASNENYPKRKC